MISNEEAASPLHCSRPLLASVASFKSNYEQSPKSRPGNQKSPEFATSCQDQCPKRIMDWAGRLERLSSSGASSSQVHSQQLACNGATTESAPRISLSSLAPAETGAPVVSRLAKVGSNEEDDVCFRFAQLATEVVLMVFAASLLVIATIVLLSKKIPAFMESYEVVPKFLFFLCLFVAAYSLARWIVVKIESKCHLFRFCASHCCHWTTASTPARNAKRARLERQEPAVSKDLMRARAAEANQEEAAARPDEKDSWRQQQLRSPLLASPSRVVSEQAERRPRQQTEQATRSGARFMHSRSCPPPTRQIAFDSPNLLYKQDDTIDEESERSVASA